MWAGVFTVIDYKNKDCAKAREQADYLRGVHEREKEAWAGRQNPISIANNPDHPDRLRNLEILYTCEKSRKMRESTLRTQGNLTAALESAARAYSGLIRDDWVNENLKRLNNGIIGDGRSASPERSISPEKLTPAAKWKRASRENLGRAIVRAKSNDRRKAKRRAQEKIISLTPGAIKRRDQREREAASGPKKLPMSGAERLKKHREKKALETKSCADTTATSVTR
jgi:hypothetical protein